MRLATGRWVSGDDFIDRESELRVLDERVRAGNHTLLTGQRRMGKTSIARELGRQLEAQGWVFVFTDVEGAACPEDVIANLAEAVHPVRSVWSRFATTMRWFKDNVEEFSPRDFRIKFRAALNAGNWRRYGGQIIRDCGAHEQPVLLVIDELPIFLKRMLGQDDGAQRVDAFLSWLREVVQELDPDSLVLIVSGSIGLKPLVQRLGIPDRINHLDPFRLGPWDRHASVTCFQRLAQSHELPVEPGVADAVYDALGTGIPHHVQSFFARLREFTIMHGRDRVTLEDVDTVYRTALLGPSGQNDLVHYETRLKEGWKTNATRSRWRSSLKPPPGSGSHRRHDAASNSCSHRSSAMCRVLSPTSSRSWCTTAISKTATTGSRFPSRLLKDWWSARFRDHYIPLEDRRGRP